MEHAIRADGLSKRYAIGARRERYDTLREALVRGARNLAPHRSGTGKTEFWALRDVSFEIAPGEVVGVIGRNGAGKTTLLRLLSRITYPTAGRAEIQGRLGALLEVGTGFHPELTGRENVFLNGAILGMRRREIARRFDEIIEFAGVDAFVDTPVKRYSSGMYVRLAFSVAAHLEPEVLLVDEVLAVGDAEFQRRCLGRMEEIGRAGRTVVLVSHSMPTVARLCERAILLDRGAVVEDGSTDAVVARYLASGLGSTALRRWDPDDPTAPGDDVARIAEVAVVGDALDVQDSFDLRERVGIRIVFDLLRDGAIVVPMLSLETEQGMHAFNALATGEVWSEPGRHGRHTVVAWIPGNLLNEGGYVVSAFVNAVASGRTHKHAHAADVVSFHVANTGEGPSAKGPLMHPWGGAVSPLLEWESVAEVVQPRA
jgi:lipopolysaccharide transport system ATP-binding protein